jgi:hypothetical protein
MDGRAAGLFVLMEALDGSERLDGFSSRSEKSQRKISARIHRGQ